MAGQSGVGTNTTVLESYLSLPQNGIVQCEYIWIDAAGELRSKTKSMKGPIKSLKDLPDWNFDGSSTGQAEGHYSEVWIRPVKIVPDPFRHGDNILVMCECLDAKTLEPHKTNRRAPANKIFEQKAVKDEETWYGIEQEYTMYEPDGVTILGWPKQGFPAPQGPYYCGIGTGKAIGRHVVEAHYRACLYAGITISGINGEVMPGQWEFQVGPCVGIDSGDQLWLARYILQRVGEDFGVGISFSPKPVKGDWNGTGCHTNYSTKSMRTKPIGNKKNGPKLGMDAILEGIDRLGKKHMEHINVYGKGNEERLLGSHETAKYDQFKYGVADRGASIRIPRQTDKDGYGYLEDRRPAGNMDPYQVTSMIANTTING